MKNFTSKIRDTTTTTTTRQDTEDSETRVSMCTRIKNARMEIKMNFSLFKLSKKEHYALPAVCTVYHNACSIPLWTLNTVPIGLMGMKSCEESKAWRIMIGFAVCCFLFYLIFHHARRCAWRRTHERHWCPACRLPRVGNACSLQAWMRHLQNCWCLSSLVFTILNAENEIVYIWDWMTI